MLFYACQVSPPEKAAEFSRGTDRQREIAAMKQTAVIIREVRRNPEHWQKQGLRREGKGESMAVQFIGMLLGTFSTKSLLGIAPMLTEKQIGEWVSKCIALFLEGALPRERASTFW